MLNPVPLLINIHLIKAIVGTQVNNLFPFIRHDFNYIHGHSMGQSGKNNITAFSQIFSILEF